MAAVVERAVPFDKSDYQSLVGWAKSRDDLFSCIRYSQSAVGNTKTYVAETVLSHSLAKDVVGIGRSRDPLQAVAISVSEAIERLEMRGSLGWIANYGSCFAEFSSDGVTTLDGELELPPACFGSSNGWAAHFDSDLAVRSAIFEALERTLNLVNFGRHGWAGFERVTSEDLGPNVEAYLGRGHIAGHRAGFVAMGGASFSGRSLGYWVAPMGSAPKSTRIKQAYHEALGAVEFVEKHGRLPLENNPISHHQNWLLANRWPSLERFSVDQPCEALKDSITCGIRLANVQSKWGMPVPFYVAYAYGGDLVPLYFRSSTDSVGLRYLQEKLRNYGVDEVRFDHPVL